MNKSRIGLFVVTILLVATAIFFFLSNRAQTKEFEGIPAANVVSANSPVVLVVDGVSELKKSLIHSEIWHELKDVDSAKELENQISFLEKEILVDENISDVLNSRKIVVSLNFIGKKTFDYLFASALHNQNEWTHFNTLISDLAAKKNWQISSRDYSSKTIHIIRKSNKILFCYSVSRGILMLSGKQILVEDGIRQLAKEKVVNNDSFDRLYEITGDDSNLSVFINHREFPRFLSIYLNRSSQREVSKFNDYALWSGIDIDIRKNKVLFNGFSLCDDTLKNYLEIFSKQRPVRKHIDDVLPAQTTMFIDLGFSDYEQFQKDYERYLHGTPEYFKRLNELKNIEKITRTSMSSFFNNVMDNEVAISVTDFNEKSPASSAYLVCQVKSKSQATEELMKMLQKFASKKDKTLKSITHTYAVDKELKFDIYEFPSKKVAEVMFGRLFKWVDASYVTFFDNYMIFGNSVKSLSKFLYSNVLNETLSRDTKYVKYADELTGKGNLFCYVNGVKGIKMVESFVNSDLKKVIEKNADSFRKMKAFTWQFGSDNGMGFNYATLNYDPSIREEPQATWSQNLQQKIDFKPVFVENHRDRKNKEVIVQDKKNVLYLINKQGRIVWKQQIDDKIKGKVHQVDYYRNGKLQYLFNTSKKIYLIDRNGNSVAKYPVNLRSDATNGLAVFDYDKNRDYRIAVATANHKVYLYKKDGKLVSGWKFGKTDSDVTFEAQHFRVGNKDYIVFADNRKLYILNRQGRIRVKTQAKENLSNNPVYLEKGNAKHAARLVYSNSKGDVCYQYFNGKHQTIDLDDRGADHLFNIADVNYDGESEFLFVDEKELTCVNNKDKNIFDHTFKKSKLTHLNVYRFGRKNVKIGITSAAENRIYLLDDDGDIYNGFPIAGASGFSVGFLSNNRNLFNLIVGTSDGYLMNYQID